MDVTYTNTRRDLFAFSMGHYARSPITWFSLALLVIVTLPSLLGVMDPTGDIAFGIAVAVVLESFIVAFAIIVWVVIVALAISLQRKVGILTQHVIGIDPEAITESTDVNQLRTTWAGVSRVRRHGNLLVVYLSPATAHVIPRRAFQTQDEWARFGSLSQEYWQAARA